MIRSHARVRRWTATVALITAVVTALLWLWAPRAYADDPHERPCEFPTVEPAVRAALPLATKVRCPVEGSVSTPDYLAPVTAEAVLPDGRLATLDVVVDPTAKIDPAHPENAPRKVVTVTYQHSDLTGSSGKGM